MIDRFLASGDEQLTQVESDVLVGPGQIKVLVDAYWGVKNLVPDMHIANTYHHTWCKRLIKVMPIGEYRLAITDGFSEAFWTSDRESLKWAVDNGKIPADRPDLQLWTLPPPTGLCGATFYQPEIQAQHIGAGKASLIYSYFPWDHVVYHSQNETMKDSGPLRQPYPEYPIVWPDFETRMPQSAIELYEYLRAKSEVRLPEIIL
jgi:hypothetical protein